MKALFFMATSLFLLVACSSPSPNSGTGSALESKQLTFSLARTIVPGKTSTAEMRQLLGPPDSVRKLTEGDREIWTYLQKNDPSTRRMYALVLGDPGLVKSVTWNVFEEDPESNLEYTKSALGNPSFTRSEPKWTRGDAAPDEVYLSSEKSDVTIVLRKTLNRVDTIIWH